jgi:hypothetical protein
MALSSEGTSRQQRANQSFFVMQKTVVLGSTQKGNKLFNKRNQSAIASEQSQQSLWSTHREPQDHLLATAAFA